MLRRARDPQEPGAGRPPSVDSKDPSTGQQPEERLETKWRRRTLRSSQDYLARTPENEIKCILPK